MDASRFDRLVASFVRPGSRRGLLRLLAAVPVVSLPLAAPSLPAPLAGLVATEGEAAKRRQRVSAAKKKKKKCARAGQSTSKKRKKCCAGLSKNASGVCTQPSPPPGPPSPPKPPSCNCSATQLCVAGVCQECTVTCSGSPTVCGTALQTALSGSASTIYVCPGRYQPPAAEGFTISAAAGTTRTVIGAGQGTASASNTILDANNQGRGLAINIDELGGANPPAGTVVLEQLRIINGNSATTEAAGGIAHENGTLRMTDCSVLSSSNNTPNGQGGGIWSVATTNPGLEMTRCTVSENTVTGTGGNGGGLYIQTEPFTLTDCLIERNFANSDGGGIYFSAAAGTLSGTTQVQINGAGLGGGIFAQSGSLTIAETCRVTHNRAAAAGNGGGINNAAASVTLQGAGPTSPIVVNNCHENCAGSAPVDKCAATPISCPE
jgi:hypothetical protein